MNPIIQPPESGETPRADSNRGEAWVRTVLEPDQLSSYKGRFGLARLSRGTVILLWALRIYVLLMIALVGLQIWNAVHSPQ